MESLVDMDVNALKDAWARRQALAGDGNGAAAAQPAAAQQQQQQQQPQQQAPGQVAPLLWPLHFFSGGSRRMPISVLVSVRVVPW